ncbi:hypothetical protein LTR27_001946 [Elasticomyces elasticus]|nr:hypothetical protein LTR27_001946 [Elasticomyces elasticus]
MTAQSPWGCLNVVKLDEAPEYEALSYVWGETTGSRAILLAGEEHKVTANLHGALGALRYTDRPRLLWVDAVCINQADILERNTQVAIMGSIYRKALRTVVWLDGIKGDVVEHIRIVSQNPSTHFQKLPIHAVLQIIKGAWWNRVWTLQEAVLGKELIFYATSTKTLTLEHFEGYTNALRRHYLSTSNCCEQILEAKEDQGEYILLHSLREMTSVACTVIVNLLSRRQLVRKGETFDVLKLAFEQSPREATNLRDKLYGYFGLCDDLPEGCIDYQRPLDACFVLFARHYIENTSLRILSYVVHPTPKEIAQDTEPIAGRGVPHSQRLENLPSWCPDWSQSSSLHGLVPRKIWHNTLEQFSPFSADFGPQHPGFFSISKNSVVEECLRVSGITIDEIMELGPFQSRVMLPSERVYRESLSLLGSSRCYQHATCDGCEDLVWGLQMVCEQCENMNLCPPCFNERIPGHPDEHEWNTVKHIESKETHTEGYVNSRRLVWESLADIRYRFVEGGECVQDAFRKTMMLNRSAIEVLSLEPRMRSLFDIVAFTEFWLRYVEQREEIRIKERHDYDIDEIEDMMTVITPKHVQWVQKITNASIYRKRLFITAQGYIGLAPANAEVGDLLSAVYGSHMPYVLRKLGAGRARDAAGLDCTLVGDAYVHGLMNGEADKLATAFPESATRFIIH